MREKFWRFLSKYLLKPCYPFWFHRFIFSICYFNGLKHPEKSPVFSPDKKQIQKTHIAECMRELKIENYKTFHQWSSDHREAFWEMITKKLKIIFKKNPSKTSDFSLNPENPTWFPHAEMNIADSCFLADPNKAAIIYLDSESHLQTLDYKALDQLSNRIANSLVKQGFLSGDAIAINMPMTVNAVAIYLGIIKMGGVVISIADSFSSEEIATRLKIGKAKGIFCENYFFRQNKKIPLYEKIIAANAPRAIVISSEKIKNLREDDLVWEDFLVEDTHFVSIAKNPHAPINILFSSGTTGDPKAIPWDHTTPIKTASDAFLHQDIHAEDTLLWPTNLGWMMGPWVLFASFINQATLALYPDVARGKSFGKFVQNAKVTMLGVVPTLVADWRQTHCMKGLNWQSIRLFSSTGESSNPEDMLYLSSLASYKPIIEYCGGTEIGGGYVTSTLVEKNYLSLCTTPALGLDFILLDENGKETDDGEVAIIPPSIGLSRELLNADHEAIYFADMPRKSHTKLRRHGDHLKRFSNRLYSILGRVDDTMNLGGIKISAVEIERVLVGLDNIIETAAVAISKQNIGPSQLILFAATEEETLSKEVTRQLMQQRINQHLNPLFKIHEVVFVKELPKTASNKIMRRTLRKQYQSKN